MEKHTEHSKQAMQAMPENRLSIALAITLAILAAELIGGILSNSLALISDAGHVFTDSLALSLSLIAARITRAPINLKATYGYHRVGLLAAVLNGIGLLVIAGVIFYKSYKRFIAPVEIDLSVMMPIALAGFAANLIMVYLLSAGHKDLNIKSAWLHVIGDTLSSAGVIVSGGVIYLTGWVYADSIAGFLIGIIIITGGIRVVRDAVHVFLDLTPKGFNVEEIAGSLCKISGVLSVHDVHLRALTHGSVAFTAHIRVEDQMLNQADTMRKSIEQTLQSKGIDHTVLQIETLDCGHGGLYCARIHE